MSTENNTVSIDGANEYHQSLELAVTHEANADVVDVSVEVMTAFGGTRTIDFEAGADALAEIIALLTVKRAELVAELAVRYHKPVPSRWEPIPGSVPVEYRDAL